MPSKFLVFLLFGFLVSAYAASVSVEEPLEEDDLQTVEFTESAEKRGLITNTKGEHRCSCATGTNCGCCARPRIPVLDIKVQGCLNVTIDPAAKTLDVLIEGENKVILSKKISTVKAERVCDRLPGKLDYVKICLYTTTTELEDKSGIQSCAKIDLMKDSKIIAKVIFACVQFKDGKLSLNDSGEVKASQLFAFKTGNIFKGILNALGLRQPSHKE